MRLRGAMRAVAVLVCMAVMVSAEDDDLTVSDEGGAELAEPIEPAEPAEPASADVDRAETIHSEGLVKLRGLGGERQHVGAGIEILKEAVKAGSGGAGYDLALFYEEAGTGFTDVNEALKYYTAAADEGHAAAQSALAHMYDTGIGGVEPDPAKATLYHYFASTGGNVASLMALGYKHMHGIGVPKSCDTAFSYYNPAAELVINEAQKPEGTSRFERIRLADVGEERAGHGEEDKEIIEYYDYTASKGDTRAQLAMGQLNYWGARGLEQDFEAASVWFGKAAEGGESHAMSMLGHMYANGLAVEQSNETALEWFNKAHDLGFAGATNGLGFMYMHGMGVEQDYDKALENFVLASERGNAEAHFNLGAMYIDGIGVTQDNSKALQHFAVAAGEGHTMALYNLAVMHHNGLGTGRSCELALQYLKNVVERGSWVSILQNASKAFDDEAYEESFRLYSIAGEQGVEMAQANAAWIADRGLGVGTGQLIPTDEERHRLALHYYTLSAQQSNAGSLLKLADYSYYGLGTDVDYEEAAGYYMQSSEMRNAQAYFNLGYMHQFGHGLPQDYHLARRFYDLTMQVSDTPAMQAPVILAMYGLRLAVWWSEARNIFPGFVVSFVDDTVTWMTTQLFTAGAPHAGSASASVQPPGGEGGGEAEAEGSAEGGSAADSDPDEASARAEGLWKSWEGFVKETMGTWNLYTESLRLMLDPATIKATLSGYFSAEVLDRADSDMLLIAALCTLLTAVVLRRWRGAGA